MKKEHPLAFILRKKKATDLDSAFDLICAYNYFAGQFGNPTPTDENRECWEHIKKLLTNKQ